MIRLNYLAAKTFAADMLGAAGTLALSAAGWCAHCWQRLTRDIPPDVMASEPLIPAEKWDACPRDIHVDADTLDEAANEAVVNLLRRYGFVPTPVSAEAEIEALEAIWRAPAAEGIDK